MTTFAELGIDPATVNALTSLGFSQPTPAQKEVIPVMLNKGRDLVCLAQTGTGKTAAFGLPLLQLVDPAERATQALILCPTRELCLQVSRDLMSFSGKGPGPKVLAVYGGSPIMAQIKALRRGVQIIVATPGRLNDLIRRRDVKLSAVRHLVFDEADEMLNMGFQEELNAILAHTPAEKNSYLFSATMAKEVAAIAANYMDKPLELTLGKRNAGASNVRHDYCVVQGRDRYPALKRIVDNAPEMYAIIFCRTRHDTNDVAARLQQDGYNCDALHGELNQGQRDQVMRRFRARELQLLVATDVAARGLDVSDLSHVLNFNLPDDIASYTHRSGRTGRAGRSGISISLVQSREVGRIKAIARRINCQFNQSPLPTGAEICETRVKTLVAGLAEAQVADSLLDPLLAKISDELAHLDRDDLLKRLLATELKQVLEYYQDAPDLNVKVRPAKGRGQLKGKGARPQEERHRESQRFSRFLLNVGRRQGIMPQGLMGRINKIPGKERIQVGKIEINRNTAWLEADSRFAPEILAAFQQQEINGKTVAIEVARTPLPRGGRKRPASPRKYRGPRR
ncbi:MAG: DEAD/DEAH box helicase [Thermodesulfobacteriota bacterium]